jgi:hypothetical protein
VIPLRGAHCISVKPSKGTILAASPKTGRAFFGITFLQITFRKKKLFVQMGPYVIFFFQTCGLCLQVGQRLWEEMREEERIGYVRLG